MSGLADKRSVLVDRLRAIDESLNTLRAQFADASLPAAPPSRVLHANRGLILTTDTFTNLRSNLIADLAARHRLPTISAYERFPKDGGLMYYGATINVPDQFRQAATYVDRIFKGVKPGELPIQRADKYSLIINLKTAKALGNPARGQVFAHHQSQDRQGARAHRPAAANGSG
jgi:hypothetical protein